MSVEHIAPVATVRTVVLIACGKRKLGHRATAENIYTGALFVKSLAYARVFKPDAIYILSAKHGLLGLEQEIDPYELSLNFMPKPQRKAWATGVCERLQRLADLQHDRFVVLAGERYCEGIVPYLAHVERPLLGLPQGKQLQFLTRARP